MPVFGLIFEEGPSPHQWFFNCKNAKKGLVAVETVTGLCLHTRSLSSEHPSLSAFLVFHGTWEQKCCSNEHDAMYLNKAKNASRWLYQILHFEVIYSYLYPKGVLPERMMFHCIWLKSRPYVAILHFSTEFCEGNFPECRLKSGFQKDVLFAR